MKKMKPGCLALGMAILTCMISPAKSNASTLSVDFSDSDADVAAGYAGFVFSNNTVPGTRTYLSGTTGYTGLMDTGSGIGVTLLDPNNPSRVFRLVDRGGADLLLRDFAGRDGALNQAQDLSFSGLVSGAYSLTIPLSDFGNQVGVADVQLSVNGGASFSNIYDNLNYGSNLGRTAQLNFDADGINNVIARFFVGGNEFGVTGGTTNNINVNRIFTINGFDLQGPTVTQSVPEPNSVVMFGLLGMLLFSRRYHKS
ncbi:MULTISPECIES: PEP-CTERM sorting domain-containing protein [unclassified Anabaena]|uniref:PEP-CTERM sorting domain-containing protein n=1 Tax=unclassified Anabaena TaxID=2619674 RepID=UPI0039C5DA3E